MISCLIIADTFVVEMLSNYVYRLEPLLTIQGSTGSFEEGLLLIQLSKPAIVFIDCELLNTSRKELLSHYDKCCFVCLSETIFSENGLGSASFDHLQKPVQFSNFTHCIKNYGSYLYRTVIANVERQIEAADSIKLKDRDFKDQFIKYSDITHVQGMENYVKFFSRSGSFFVKKLTMKATLQELPEFSFSRVHRSFVVNDQLIERIEGNSIYMDDNCNTRIPIGNTYKSLFFDKYNIVQGRHGIRIKGIDLPLVRPYLLFLLLFHFHEFFGFI